MTYARIFLGILGAVGTMTGVRSALAEPTREVYIQGDEIFEGDPESTSIDARGMVSMGPTLTSALRGLDQPIVCLASGPGGSLLAGTAGGGLIKISASGQKKVLTEAKERAVTALTRVGNQWYAATSPKGEILSVKADGTTKPYFQSDTRYIWSMLPDKNALIVATGEPGRILKVSAGGRSEVMFDAEETHIRTLVRHPTRGLVAGGGQKGIVYQISGQDKAFALYDSELEEITALAVDPKTGDLYAAAVSESKKGTLQPDTWIGPVKGDVEPDDKSPIKSSEVVRITKSGHVETVWSSKQEGALALHFDEKKRRLYITTGTSPKGRARLYAVDVDGHDRLYLFARFAPSLATAILTDPQKGSLLVGTAPGGGVMRVGPQLRSKSTYLSVEQDLGRSSEIGRVWFDAIVPKGARVEVSIRTGNTETPDKTWSSWSKTVQTSDGGDVDVPQGRYAQLRAVLTASSKGQAPWIRSLHASVVRMNVAPDVKDVFLLKRGVYMRSLPKEADKERTVTLSASTFKKLRTPSAPRAKATRVRQGIQPGMMTVAWDAKDPNRDGLLFNVEIRSLNSAAGAWRSVAEQTEDPYFSFDSRAYVDGRYQFRVTATDRPANPPDQALTDQRTSPPFIVDNGAPRLEAVKATLSKDRLTVQATAKDAVTIIAAAELSIDGGPWMMLPAKDGLIDAKTEALSVVVPAKDFPKTSGSKPRAVLIRVEDDAGNEITASARVTSR